jgi:hypothetical protein
MEMESEMEQLVTYGIAVTKSSLPQPTRSQDPVTEKEPLLTQLFLPFVTPEVPIPRLKQTLVPCFSLSEIPLREESEHLEGTFLVSSREDRPIHCNRY